MRRIRIPAAWWLPALLLTLVPLTSAWAAGTPAGTVISNHATLTYKDANGNALPQINSNTVTTVVSQVAGVDVSPATSASNVAVGSTVTFHVHVTNLGNGSDTFDLSTTSLPAGWSAVVYGDPNENDALDAEEIVGTNIVSTVSLAADSVEHLFLVVTAAGDASDGDAQATTLTATSQYDGGVSDSGTYTATVQTAVLNVTKTASPLNPKPGDIVTYKLYGENQGTGTAFGVVVTDALPSGVTYVPGSIRYGTGASITYDTATPATDADDAPDPADFGVTASNTVTVSWGNSPSGEVGAIFFRAQVNDGLAAGTSVGNIASIVYSATDGGPLLPVSQSSTGSFTVQASPSIALSATSEAQTGQPSDSLWYPITITNAGNSTDFINISTTSSLGFSNIIWLDANNDGIPGNDGDYILTDTDSDGKVNTPILTAGSSANIIVIVVVTPGTADMSVDVTTLTLTSDTDPSITATSTLTTTAYAPVLTILKSVSPTGAQPPSTVLTYTVTVTNTGHGSATGLQLVDIVPNNTTYVASSITVDGSARTDAADGDNASIQSSSVIANFTSLGPGGTKTLTFQAQID